MASIREKRPGVWEVRVSTGRRKASGGYVYATARVYGGKRDAQREANRMEVVHGSGDAGGTDPTIAALLRRWMEHIADRGRAPSTLKTYRGYIDREIVPAIGGLRVGQLTSRRLDDMYRDMSASGLSDLTVHHVHSIIRAALNQAARWDMVDRNVAERATPPAAHAKRSPPPAPDVLAGALTAAAVIGPGVALFVRLAAITGARRGELVALRWSDVDLDAGTVTVKRARTVLRGVDVERATKTRSERSVHVDAGTVAMLRAYHSSMVAAAAVTESRIVPDPFVLASDTTGGAGWTPDHATYVWGRVRAAAGIGGVRLHDLRHWMVTTALAEGHDLATVANRAGHADGSSTTLRVYAHGRPEADARVAETLHRVLGGR